MASTLIHMKTALISLLAATFIGLISFASGAFDAAHFISALLAAGLVAWTVEQYSREPRPLDRVRPLRLPSPVARPAAPKMLHRPRLAA